MNEIIQMKKSNLLAILESTEDEKLINFLNSFVKGYQKNSEKTPEVKTITTEDELKNTEEIAKNKIKDAALTLDGELYIIEKNTKKIAFLIQELQEEYFFKLDSWNEEDEKEILYGYEKNSIYADIISDNVFEIKRTLEKINAGGSNNE